MPASSLATAPQATATPSPSINLWDFAEACLQRTAGALHESRSATNLELSQAITAARESYANGKPLDILESLARIQGHDEAHISAAILTLGEKVSHTLSPYAPLIPFGGKFMTPSAYYEIFDYIHKLARILQSPIIYAEDMDAIGTASANPMAAAVLAEEIQSYTHKRFGIRPFVSIARLDYETWTFLTRKHFEP
jgi:hypothetical protein